MRKSVVLAAIVALAVTTTRLAGAQDLRPRAASPQRDDSVRTNEFVNNRPHRAIGASDSGHSTLHSAIVTFSGAVLGSAAGFAIELHENPNPPSNCELCSINSTKQNAALRNGAIVGGLVGGAIGWYFFGRK